MSKIHLESENSLYMQSLHAYTRSFYSKIKTKWLKGGSGDGVVLWKILGQEMRRSGLKPSWSSCDLREVIAAL